KGVNAAPVDLYAFGNATRPQAPRLVKDMELDTEGMVTPEEVVWPKGKSTNVDPKLAGLTGHYHLLPEGSPMPLGLKVIRDGSEVEGPQGPGHATIYPTQKMTPEEYRELVLGLPWRHAGKIR
ncbi:MAG: hypothetical protein ABI083_07875, partial [Lapillicoccus sp.]